MTVRAVEWKKPYTWGTAIEIDENKVISLRLRDENNLIIYDAWDNEIYVDLQLPDWIRPLDAFPVGVTTGRVLVADDWDKTGTIICAKTTSGDNIKVLYADDWTLWIDNWTWIFKQIYFKADVDLIIQAIQNQIDALSGLGKFLSLWDGETWMPISFPLSTPYEYHTWDWYMINVVDNTTNYRPNWTEFDGTASSTVETQATEIWDVYIYDWSTWLLQKNGWWWGSAVLFSQVLWDPYSNTNLATALNAKQDELTAWTNIQISNNVISATWWSDIVYATQAEYNALLPWALTDGKHYFIYSTDGGGWWQPWVNTLVYMPIDSSDTASTVYDHSSNNTDFTWYWTADYDTLTSWKRVINLTWSNGIYIDSALVTAQPVTINLWLYRDWNQSNDGNVFANQQDRWWMCVAWFSNSQLASFYDQNGSLVWFNNKYSTSDQTWYNVAITFDSNTLTMYVNWTQYTQNSWNSCDFSSVDATSFWFTRHAWGSSYNRRYMTWKMWDLIVESKVWTATEISDYYDSSKWQYGIS